MERVECFRFNDSRGDSLINRSALELNPLLTISALTRARTSRVQRVGFSFLNVERSDIPKTSGAMNFRIASKTFARYAMTVDAGSPFNSDCPNLDGRIAH
jgi:hypothetical protein